MATLVKLFLVPGSIGFLVLGVLAGLALLYAGKRAQRWGRIWLTVLAVVYGVLSTPIGADLAVAPLSRGRAPIAAAAEIPNIETIVVLSTGGEVYRAGGYQVAEMGRMTAFNAMEAARLYRLLGPKATVIASGGIVNPGERARPEADVLAEGLVRLGVPRAQIIQETQSRTTREQAVHCAAILGRRKVSRFLLVTTVDHMPRAEAAFRAQSVQPVPSPSFPKLSPGPRLLDKLRPGVNSLRQSEWAAHEYLARIYYWMKGWTGRKGATGAGGAEGAGGAGADGAGAAGADGAGATGANGAGATGANGAGAAGADGAGATGADGAGAAGANRSAAAGAEAKRAKQQHL